MPGDLDVDEDLADLDLPAKAALGYYTIRIGEETGPSSVGSFYVEEYKKPEYEVRVTPEKPRVLQGEKVIFGVARPLDIDARMASGASFNGYPAQTGLFGRRRFPISA